MTEMRYLFCRWRLCAPLNRAMLLDSEASEPDGDNTHPEDGDSDPDGQDVVNPVDTSPVSVCAAEGNNEGDDVNDSDGELCPGEFDLDDLLQEVAEKAVANPKIKLGKIIQRLADKREQFGDDMSMEDILKELDTINYDLETEETATVDVNVLPVLDVPPKPGANVEGASIFTLLGYTGTGQRGGEKGVAEGEYAEKRDYLDHVDHYEEPYGEKDLFEGAHEGDYYYDSRLDVDHSLDYYKYDRDSEGRRIHSGKEAAGDYQSSNKRRPRNKTLDRKRNFPGTARSAPKRTRARGLTYRRRQNKTLVVSLLFPPQTNSFRLLEMPYVQTSTYNY